MRTKKRIALVSHDGRKLAMLRWVNSRRDFLKKFKIIGTSGTAKAISEVCDLEIESSSHGIGGGDVIIASQILEGKIDVLIFFIDTMTPHGHEHDVQSLIRTATTMNIPFALNSSTAELIIDSLDSEKE
jgi:methylglyoxal synthase